MKNFIDIFVLYIKSKLTIIVTLIMVFIIFLTVFTLYSLPLEPIVYAFFLNGTFILILGGVRFTLFYKKHKFLLSLKSNITNSGYKLPHSNRR